MTPNTVSTRRGILGTVAAILMAGCPGLTDVEGCWMTVNQKFDADSIERFSFGHTTNNVRSGGSCDRWNQERCFEAELRLDPTVVDRVVARRPSGETILSKNIGEQQDVTLELAVVGYGETAERHVLVFGDGEVIDRASVTLDCPDRGA